MNPGSPDSAEPAAPRSPAPVETVESTPSAPAPSAAARNGVRWWRVPVAFWKCGVGALATQSLLGAVLMHGWIMRVMQRSALKAWWKCSSARQSGQPLSVWLARQDPHHEHVHWPNWFLRQNAGRSDPALARQRWWKRWRDWWLGSLTLNGKLGVQGLINTWALTLPACALWLFSWYAGWNNSFNKGYEQAPVGPIVGILGIGLFMAAMLYVPMAQARQAVTGQWRSFYQFGLVWGLIRRHRWSCFWLALAYAAISIPITALKTAPYFLALDPNSPIPGFTPDEARAYLLQYFLWSGLALFLAWLILRPWAARLYAKALLRGLQRGEVAVSELGDWERRELSRLDLIQIHPPRSRHVLMEMAAGTSTSVWRAVLMTATLLVWFVFVAQIYISEFLLYHPVQGWLNQPLVQLPWFQYMPPHLQTHPFGELLATLFLLGTVFLLASLGRRWSSFWQRHRRRRRGKGMADGDTVWIAGQ